MLTQKQITTLGKLIPRKSPLPILKNILVKDEVAYTSNLEMVVGFAVDMPDCLIPFADLKKISKVLKNPVFEYEENETCGNLTIRDGKRKFEFETPLIEDFPEIPIGKKSEVLTLDSDKIKKFLSFAATDDLRPAMNAMALTKEGMCSTDAHMLIYDRDIKVEEETLIPREVSRVLMSGEYKISNIKETNQVFLENKKEEQFIYVRAIDGNFPNWPAVIPEKKDMTNFIYATKEEWLEKLTAAEMISQQHITFLKGQMEAKDVDLNKSFSDSIMMSTGELTYCFNPALLKKIISVYEGEDVKLMLDNSNPLKPTLIGDNFLLMPIEKRHE